MTIVQVQFKRISSKRVYFHHSTPSTGRFQLRKRLPLEEFPAMMNPAYYSRKVQPEGAMRDYIEYFYIIRSTPDLQKPTSEPWFPSGTMDLVIDLGSPFEQGVLSGPVQVRPRAFVAGLYEEGIKIRPTGTVNQLGIVFKPGKFRYFIPGDQKELKGLVTPLKDVFGSKADRLVDHLCGSDDELQQITLVRSFLEKSFRFDLEENYFLDLCIQNIQVSRGKVQLGDFARKAKTSNRHFRRIFKEYIGITPKLYCMMTRLQNVLKLRSVSPMNLNRIASELGYYDPSHLSREFKNIAGMKAVDFVRSEDFISRCLIAETKSIT